MGVWMRALMTEWPGWSVEQLLARARTGDGAELRAAAGAVTWKDLRVLGPGEAADGSGVLDVDLTVGDDVCEEVDELREHLDDLTGTASARERVGAHLEAVVAIVGMQIVLSAYDDSVGAANAIITALEGTAPTFTQVDTVGYYDLAGRLLLTEPD